MISAEIYGSFSKFRLTHKYIWYFYYEYLNLMQKFYLDEHMTYFYATDTIINNKKITSNTYLNLTSQRTRLFEIPLFYFFLYNVVILILN